jgi:succinate dehydrogenase / fumarate reductase iron-sulfur subunit
MKIFRFDPQEEKEPHYDTFTVEANPDDRLLDCLNKIRWEQDASLSYRMSCAHGICGSDGMTINGVTCLACQKLVKDFDYTREIVIEPLQFFPVTKDLIVDVAPFFYREKAIHPTHGISMKPSEENKEHVQTVEERERFEEDIKCIMCACCMAACPVNLREDPSYIGPAAIVRAHRYIFDSRVNDAIERMKIMDKPHGIWACKTYWKCTEICPKKIPITEHILETKKKIWGELHPRNDALKQR